MPNRPPPQARLTAVAAIALAAALAACAGDAAPGPAPGATADAGTVATDGAAPRTKLTWYRDVLPIFQRRCLGCHSTGGIGPFQLARHDQVKNAAQAVRRALAIGRMPPWMPSATCAPLENVRRLPDAEKKTLLAWLDGGMPAGDPKDAPPPPKENPDTLGWVDRALKLPAPYTPARRTRGGSEADDYHCFVLDPKLTRDEGLTGIRFRPGSKKMAHHVLLYVVDLAAARAREASPGKGYTCYGGPGVRGTLIGGWVPGTSAMRFPAGSGMVLPRGKGIVMQIHYSFANLAPGKSETDSTSTLELQFARKPLARKLRFLALADRRFRVPPGARGFKAGASLTSPAAARLWGILPHMHQAGKAISVTLERAGKKQCLVDIPKWDFNWQQLYLYKTTAGLPVARGDKITLTCVYDNAGKAALTWGESTDDEMCLVYFLVSVGR